jgi:hypothetical protein
MVEKRKCGAKTTAGNPCQRWAIKGGTVCQVHGGAAPAVKAKAAVRAELLDWGITDKKENPEELLLRLMTQSYNRAQLYGRLLQEAYEAAERLAQSDLDSEELVGDVPRDGCADGSTERQRAIDELDRIFSTGGVAALIGHTYGAAKDVGVYVTGEAIRGLAKLERDEREFCANLCAKAVAAGLIKKQTDLANIVGEMLVKSLQTVLDRVGLTEDQKQQVKAELRALPAA